MTVCVETDVSKCRGCEMCALECALAHVGAPIPARARISVFQDLGVSTPRICVQCESPACVEACVQDALYLDEDKGIYRVDEEKCVGCGACATACSFGAIRMDPVTEKPLICDLCGGHPRCVEVCPFDALACVGKEDT
jgi:Fe-S-cluster-containing hydrogenase component 2